MTLNRFRLLFLSLFSFLLFSHSLHAQNLPAGKLLVWLAEGAGPDAVGASTPGQVGYMDSNGTLTPLNLEIPQGTSRVVNCALSADGTRTYFFVGQTEGTLYALNSGQVDVLALDSVPALTCVARNALQLSADGTRLAYIDFEPPQANDEFSDGRLRLLNSADLSRINLRENDVVDTAAFDLTNTQLAFIRLPQTGERREALEGVVNLIEGNGIREVAVLRPDAENQCRFTSASVEILPNGQLLALMGHRCRRGETQTTWRMFLIDPASRDSFRQIAGGTQGGGFFPEVRTNNLIAAPTGTNVLFSLPDGLESFSAALNQLTLSSEAVTPLVPIGVRYPRVANKAYFLDEVATPILAPSLNHYAYVQKDPNNNQTLFVANLDAGTQQAFPAPNKGDNLSNLTFAPDSARLVYVQGGTASQENVLMQAFLDNNSSSSVIRGRFGNFVLSPDGLQVAIMEWQTVEDPNQPPYLSLAVVDLTNSTYYPIWNQGAVITAEGKVTEQKFVYPLVWMK